MSSPQATPDAPVNAAATSDIDAALPRRGGAAALLLGSRFGPFIGVGAVLVLLCAYMAVTQPVFGSGDNLTNLMRSMAIPMVLAGQWRSCCSPGASISRWAPPWR
jgi:hypothetical protein